MEDAARRRTERRVGDQQPGVEKTLAVERGNSSQDHRGEGDVFIREMRQASAIYQEDGSLVYIERQADPSTVRNTQLGIVKFVVLAAPELGEGNPTVAQAMHAEFARSGHQSNRGGSLEIVTMR